MAELPRYKRPSSLITSGDVQTANISALVQAQQMQSQAITKGIDTVIQFALAKGERDLKITKLNALQDKAAVMPKITEAIAAISAEVETNPKYSHEQIANDIKQLYGFVKPIYEVNGEVGTTLYNEINELAAPITKLFTQKRVEIQKAATKIGVDNTAVDRVNLLSNVFFDETNTDNELITLFTNDRNKFSEQAIIALGDKAQEAINKYDEELELVLVSSFSRYMIEASEDKDDGLALEDKLQTNNFGVRTKFFLSLPPSVQKEIKSTIRTDFNNRVELKEKQKEEQYKKDRKQFYEWAAMYDRHDFGEVSEEQLLTKMYNLAYGQEQPELLNFYIKLQDDIRTEDQEDYYLAEVIDIIQDPRSFDSSVIERDVDNDLIHPSQALKLINLQEKLSDRGYRDGITELKILSKLPDGIFTIGNADDKAKQTFAAAFDKFNELVDSAKEENPNQIPDYDTIVNTVIASIPDLKRPENNTVNTTTNNSPFENNPVK